MQLTFLGTGAAGGVPLYGCDCAACRRAQSDSRFVRRPCSALVEAGKTRLLLDAGPMDLHARFAPGALSAIVLTHFHPDHVQGLFHWRWGAGERLPVFCPPDPEGCADLFKNPGLFDFRPLRLTEPLCLGDFVLTALPLNHSKLTYGYALEAAGCRLAYLTDTCGLPAPTVAFLRRWGAFDLALDCSFPPTDAPQNHNDWTLAHTLIQTLKPRRTWLTHLSHRLDDWRLRHAPSLPEDVSVAEDGQVCEVGDSEAGCAPDFSLSDAEWLPAC
ncbi:MAG: phosphonate metabolism protein PhnP [Zoogloeaceae bacterium]|jgi:phosphoribosyl 1,2-cyclic phosphate phosphodiesterase|nr:phosphonate metabolism protein PhnP [Zoogloeaceae bacterium]